MDLARSIGNNIRSLMESRSITTVELAKTLSISRQTLQNYLKGNSVIDSVKLMEIANFFSVPINDLMVAPEEPSNFLFRTALNYQLATDTIANKIMSSIYTYYNLAKKLGSQISYFPEQYNLVINVNNSPIDINFEWNITKLKMTEELEIELRNIALEQRKKLGIYDTNALGAISLLQQKGIHILFVDFGNSQTSGLSYVDEEKGCYIFVNCNEQMTLERIIFTIFHEYGHIILHRPLYKRRLYDIENNNLNFLDKMANVFAGYFLVPFEHLSNYNSILNNMTSINQLFPIKHSFQVSLQTLVLSLSNYNYVNKTFVNNFFSYLRKNKLMEIEPAPLIENSEIKHSYESIKNAKIIELLRNGYIQGIVGIPEIKNILWLNDTQANKITKEFDCFHNFPDFFSTFSTK